MKIYKYEINVNRILIYECEAFVFYKDEKQILSNNGYFSTNVEWGIVPLSFLYRLDLGTYYSFKKLNKIEFEKMINAMRKRFV